MPRKHPLPAGANPAEHTPEAVVARMAASGALCVKIALEDGFGDQADWPIMSAQTMARVRAATKKHGMFLAVHANALDMQRMAVAGNVDLIVHGIWNWNQLQDQQGIPAAVGEHLRNVRDKKIGYQATLRVMPGVTELVDPALLDDPVYAKVVPPRLLAWYRTDPRSGSSARCSGRTLMPRRCSRANAPRMSTGPRPNTACARCGTSIELGAAHVVRQRYPLRAHLRQSARLRHLPGNAIDGTGGDSVVGDFAAATINNARQLGLAKDYGTIEKGKIANLCSSTPTRCQASLPGPRSTR